MSALIEDDERLIHRTKQFFYTNCTIYSDSEEEVDVKRKNKFSEFLEQDDRNVLRKLIENGDKKALSILDSVSTDRMQKVRRQVSDKFHSMFVKN